MDSLESIVITPNSENIYEDFKGGCEIQMYFTLF